MSSYIKYLEAEGGGGLDLGEVELAIGIDMMQASVGAVLAILRCPIIDLLETI